MLRLSRMSWLARLSNLYCMSFMLDKVKHEYSNSSLNIYWIWWLPMLTVRSTMICAWSMVSGYHTIKYWMDGESNYTNGRGLMMLFQRSWITSWTKCTIWRTRKIAVMSKKSNTMAWLTCMLNKRNFIHSTQVHRSGTKARVTSTSSLF